MSTKHEEDTNTYLARTWLMDHGVDFNAEMLISLTTLLARSQRFCKDRWTARLQRVETRIERVRGILDGKDDPT